MPDTKDWARAISIRIVDEWDGKTEFHEDSIILQNILENLLETHPEECKKLVGTGIIEENYFEEC